MTRPRTPPITIDLKSLSSDPLNPYGTGEKDHLSSRGNVRVTSWGVTFGTKPQSTEVQVQDGESSTHWTPVENLEKLRGKRRRRFTLSLWKYPGPFPKSPSTRRLNYPVDRVLSSERYLASIITKDLSREGPPGPQTSSVRKHVNPEQTMDPQPQRLIHES